MKAIWQGQVIAESEDTVVVEGNHYFPLDSLRQEFLEGSSTTTYCPWKGTAHYYSLSVNGAANPDALWYYPDPKPEAAQIVDRAAFWRGVLVTDQVAGRAVCAAKLPTTGLECRGPWLPHK